LNKKNFGILIICLGILSGILFFSTGLSIGKTGTSMTELQSVSGTSVAEAYYQNVGELAIGLSLFMYAMGLSVVTVSVGFGGKLIIQESLDKKLEDQIIKNRSSNFSESNLSSTKTETFEDLPEL